MFLFCLLLGRLINGVVANTEIINFSATGTELSNLPFTDTWHILRPENSTLRWNVISAPLEYTLSQSICNDLHEWHPVQNTNVCPHEFWLVLDLDQDGWKTYDKFTLRLSWPAYHPTDIHLTVYDPSSLIMSRDTRVTQSQLKTRRKYARIQMVHTGVLTPVINGFTRSFNETSRYDVPFIITLEPLHFGVLPSSVVPVVLTILAILVVGLPIARKIHRYLEGIAQRAREDESVAEQKED
ncbi:hypothetical protein BYT27DRAFT_7256721 [Phlegmacium glaucopus]|nr:hypothetical protein BYT27DRAFT_7256721 [Phlegmacium glaucopus]